MYEELYIADNELEKAIDDILGRVGEKLSDILKLHFRDYFGIVLYTNQKVELVEDVDNKYLNLLKDNKNLLLQYSRFPLYSYIINHLDKNLDLRDTLKKFIIDTSYKTISSSKLRELEINLFDIIRAHTIYHTSDVFKNEIHAQSLNLKIPGSTNVESFIFQKYLEEINILKEKLDNKINGKRKDLDLSNINYKRLKFNKINASLKSIHEIFSFLKYEMEILECFEIEFYLKINDLDKREIVLKLLDSRCNKKDLGMFFYYFKIYLEEEMYLNEKMVESYVNYKFKMDNDDDIINSLKRYIKPYKNSKIKPNLYTEIREFFKFSD